MRRFACHRLYTSVADCRPQSVVELQADGTLHAVFPLQEEVSATQWIGGVIVLSSFPALTLQAGETFSAFLQRATSPAGGSLYAWHITDFDLHRKSFRPDSRLRRL